MIYFILGTRPEITKAVPYIDYLLFLNISFKILLTGQQSSLIKDTLNPLISLDKKMILNVNNNKQNNFDWEKESENFLNEILDLSLIILLGDTNSALFAAQFANNRGEYIVFI